MPKSIYMDVCALSRPFDDQRYPRIRLETEAVNLILLKPKLSDFFSEKLRRTYLQGDKSWL